MRGGHCWVGNAQVWLVMLDGDMEQRRPSKEEVRGKGTAGSQGSDQGWQYRLPAADALDLDDLGNCCNRDCNVRCQCPEHTS